MKARSVLTLRLNDSSCFDLGWFIIMSHSPLAYWLQFYMIQLLVLILSLKRHQSQLYPFHTFYSNYLSAADSLFHSINYSEMNVARVRKKRNGRIWRIFWKFGILKFLKNNFLDRRYAMIRIRVIWISTSWNICTWMHFFRFRFRSRG